MYGNKTKEDKCGFCRKGEQVCDEGKLLNKLRLDRPGEQYIDCDREIGKGDLCLATLAPDQYTRGHTLVILRQHRRDMADTCITEAEKKGFIDAIHQVARHLAAELGKNDNPSPKRIYVGILCDGVEHLHAHLIPRYEFSDEDKKIYRELFTQRNGVEKVEANIDSGEMGGFWYIAEREQHYKTYQTSEAWAKTGQERAAYLEALAKEVRLSSPLP